MKELSVLGNRAANVGWPQRQKRHRTLVEHGAENCGCHRLRLSLDRPDKNMAQMIRILCWSCRMPDWNGDSRAVDHFCLDLVVPIDKQIGRGHARRGHDRTGSKNSSTSRQLISRTLWRLKIHQTFDLTPGLFQTSFDSTELASLHRANNRIFRLSTKRVCSSLSGYVHSSEGSR